MARSENTTPEIEDALNAAQVLFTANPALAPQTWRFVQAKDEILGEVEKFSSAWFKRRHDATRTAIEAGAQIASEGMRNPASAMKVIADWQAHSMQRMAEDAKECTEMFTRCASALVNQEAKAAEESVDAAKRATKTSKSEPV